MVNTTRRELLQLVASFGPAFWLASSAAAQNAPNIQLQPIGDKLTLLSGAGGNIAILQGSDGLLLIDSGLPDTAEAVVTKAKTVAPSITTLINTHFHFDHVGANEKLGHAGTRIIAHDNVLKRLSTQQTNVFFGRVTPPLPPEARPKTTFSTTGQLIHGGEKVAYKYLPPAHTDGDTTVHFANANVYHTGDLFFNGLYPFVDYSSGGNMEGMVANAERMSKAVDSKTKIIPGHGPIATLDDLHKFHTMLADVNERVSKLVKGGKTLEQVQAAEPTKSYDAAWGNGFLKPADFVRMLYAGKAAKGG